MNFRHAKLLAFCFFLCSFSCSKSDKDGNKIPMLSVKVDTAYQSPDIGSTVNYNFDLLDEEDPYKNATNYIEVFGGQVDLKFNIRNNGDHYQDVGEASLKSIQKMEVITKENLPELINRLKLAEEMNPETTQGGIRALVIIMTVNEPEKMIVSRINNQIDLFGWSVVNDPPPKLTDEIMLYEKVRYPGKVAYMAVTVGDWELMVGEEISFNAIVGAASGTKIHFEVVGLTFSKEKELFAISIPEYESSIIFH